tara:strand:- start:262 stop:495 length:234 start_codon:yes stop_codon:yes gene_type:complete
MKIIKGNFSKDKKKSLNDKITEGLYSFKDSSNEDKQYPFILIIDTGEELKIVSDVETEKFNFMLDLVKLTILTGDTS